MDSLSWPHDSRPDSDVTNVTFSSRIRARGLKSTATVHGHYVTKSRQLRDSIPTVKLWAAMLSQGDDEAQFTEFWMELV